MKYLIPYLAMLIITLPVLGKTPGKHKGAKYSFTINVQKYVHTAGITDTLFLQATLTNNTKDTLRYLNMSCSWHEIYELQGKDVSMLPWDCFNNKTRAIIIWPHRSLSVNFKLLLKPVETPGKRSFTMGMHLIKAEKKDRSKYTDMITKGRLDSTNILWSNAIKL